jgi:two-component system, LytTR family, sensor kinase
MLLLVLIVLAIHVYLLHQVVRLDWALSLQDGVYSSVILSFSVWAIVLLIRRYPTTAAIFPYALFIAIVMSLLTVMADLEIMKWWVVNDSNEEYKLWLIHSLPVRFLIIWIFNSWVATNGALRKNITALDLRFQLQTDASVLLKEAELFKLRQQLQPHFLYNSLNSISALIMISPDRAQEMIGKLSEFLRSSVKRESEDTISVREELEYIQSYLAIESVRFGDRLQVHFNKEYTDDATIPPFLLQPILENAIKFGLYGKTGTVVITINILLSGPVLTLTITNPYDADMQPPKGTGFGLEGIQRRLYLIYARTDLLETKKDEQNFTTILKIPQRYVQSDTNRR